MFTMCVVVLTQYGATRFCRPTMVSVARPSVQQFSAKPLAAGVSGHSEGRYTTMVSPEKPASWITSRHYSPTTQPAKCHGSNVLGNGSCLAEICRNIALHV